MNYIPVDSFPSTNSKLGLPQQLLCLLKEIKQLLLTGTTTPSTTTAMADPFATQLLTVSSSLATLTIPTGAQTCIVSVKGTGETRLLFTNTIDADNSHAFIQDEVFELENVFEMQKAQFKSSTTNKLLVTYYRYITA